MFRKRDPQGDLFESSNLLPPAKAARLRSSWAHAFRTKALPLIDEERFACMYHEWNGRPNREVEVVLGVLILKEMFDLTDEETLERLEYDLQWQHALRLTPEEAHLPQKTLHNVRVRLIEHDLAKVAFRETTDRIIEALGIKTTRQRLDSTHILSNIRTLTRLGLFAETIRVFLVALHREHPRLSAAVPEGLRKRYLKDDGEATAYADARSEKARRRLAVCARDLWKLVDRFRGTVAATLGGFRLLERLLREQCEVVDRPEPPEAGDDDATDGGAPVVLKEPEKISGDSLQSPHDPNATYSGHKGKGYEVQVSETCHEANPVELITHVDVTASSGSDAHATIPAIESLKERGLQPKELVADTTYGSAANALEAARLGTELVSPVGGSAPEAPVDDDALPKLSAADFDIDAAYNRPTTCPAGHESIHEDDDRGLASRVRITFARADCEACPLLARCPVKLQALPADAAEQAGQAAGYVLAFNLVQQNIDRRRQAEATGAFAARYAIRAGIEATNSELKRAHGLGFLRVRRRPRVELAVYLKALACNIKRMVRHLVASEAQIAVAGA